MCTNMLVTDVVCDRVRLTSSKATGYVPDIVNGVQYRECHRKSK